MALNDAIILETVVTPVDNGTNHSCSDRLRTASRWTNGCGCGGYPYRPDHTAAKRGQSAPRIVNRAQQVLSRLAQQANALGK
jgi:hypothetical protein